MQYTQHPRCGGWDVGAPVYKRMAYIHMVCSCVILHLFIAISSGSNEIDLWFVSKCKSCMSMSTFILIILIIRNWRNYRWTNHRYNGIDSHNTCLSTIYPNFSADASLASMQSLIWIHFMKFIELKCRLLRCALSEWVSVTHRAFMLLCLRIWLLFYCWKR